MLQSWSPRSILSGDMRFVSSEPRAAVLGGHEGSLGPQPPRAGGRSPAVIKPAVEADSGLSDA